MYLAFTLFVVFMLSATSFMLGYDVASKMQVDSIAPRTVITPKFRLIYKNPRRKSC